MQAAVPEDAGSGAGQRFCCAASARSAVNPAALTPGHALAYPRRAAWRTRATASSRWFRREMDRQNVLKNPSAGDRSMAMDARVEQRMRALEPPEPGVVAASVYASGRFISDIAINDAGTWSKKPGHVVWIGMFEPSHELLARIEAQFGLHYLAIEDAGKAHQHPKIEQYGDALFIVARTA